MKILYLAQFFMKSLLKQKATIVMTLLASIIIGVSWLMADMNIGKEFKLFEDVILTGEMFLFHLSAVFYAYEYLQKERLGGVFVLPLSTGISRKTYLLAVILSQWMMLLLFFSILFAIDVFVFYMTEDQFPSLVLWQLFLYLQSALLLSLLIITFSQFVSIMNSMIYSLTLYFLGNGLDELYVFAHYLHPDEFLQMVTMLLEYVVPNFSLFDKQSIVVNRSNFEAIALFFEPLFYMLIASVIITSIAFYKFKHRALKLGE